MEAKHFIFFLLLFIGLPSAIVVMRSAPKLREIGLFLMIFMIPFVYSTGINFFTDKFYRGTSRGYEVLGVDMITWVMAGTFIFQYGWKNFNLTPPGARMFFIYFGLSLISIYNAESLLYSGYEVMRMCFAYIYFLTLFNWIMQKKNFDMIFYAFSVIIIYTIFHMIFQKIFLGVYQPSGIFPHRNSAAMFANMVAPIFFSILLNAKNRTKFEFFLYAIAFLASCAIVVISLSRGAIAFLPISLSFVTFLSLKIGFNTRKVKILSIVAVIAIVGLMRAGPMMLDRFENAPKESAEGRVHLAKAATNMANDKFFGVGLNNWGIKINPPYTYWENTGIIRRSEDHKSGIVETVYLLIAAECGWICLISYLAWIGFYYIQNYLNIKRFKDSSAAFLPIGIIGGLTAAFGQSVLEWILKQPTNFYGLMIFFAIIAAMSQTYRKSRKSTVRK